MQRHRLPALQQVWTGRDRIAGAGKAALPGTDVDTATEAQDRRYPQALVDFDRRGSARGGTRLPDFAYLYFAAEFGGGVVARSTPLRGASGNAGAFGSVLPDGWYHPNLRRRLADRGMVFDELRTILRDLDLAVPAVDAWLDR